MNPYALRRPEAPTDIMPVPLAERSVGDLGAPSNVVATLAEAGILTVGQLLAAYPDENFTAIAGVGPSTQDKMAALLEAYRG